MPNADPLDEVLRHAGAVVSTRSGRRVAAHYGSAAAELAVCVRSVGLVDRSDLAVFAVHGPARALSDVSRALVGAEVTKGSVVRDGSHWCCRVAPSDLLVLCEPHASAALSDALRPGEDRYPDVVVRDRSDDYTAIGIVGRRAASVLATLGALDADDAVAAVGRVRPGSIGETDVVWLVDSASSALALVDPAAATLVWRAVEAVGRSLGLSYVGHDALQRFAVLERTAGARTLASWH